MELSKLSKIPSLITVTLPKPGSEHDEGIMIGKATCFSA